MEEAAEVRATGEWWREEGRRESREKGAAGAPARSRPADARMTPRLAERVGKRQDGNVRRGEEGFNTAGGGERAHAEGGERTGGRGGGGQQKTATNGGGAGGGKD